MGFDLYGLAATSENGAYFRNNCWWWRPLWNFTCKLLYPGRCYGNIIKRNGFLPFKRSALLNLCGNALIAKTKSIPLTIPSR